MSAQIPTWQVVSRWLVFLPVALVAAFLVSVVMNLLSRLSMYLTGVDPDGFLNKLWLDVVSSGLMGATLVYVGSRIAPMHRNIVGYILTVVGILIAGFLAYPAVLQRNWWALVGRIAMAVGAALVAYSVSTGELDLETHTFN